MNDWWDDDSIEISDRIQAMQTEIARLRELSKLLSEQNDSLKKIVSEQICPRGKSWLTVDADGNTVLRNM
jgi:hypothetical protein